VGPGFRRDSGRQLFHAWVGTTGGELAIHDEQPPSKAAGWDSAIWIARLGTRPTGEPTSLCPKPTRSIWLPLMPSASCAIIPLSMATSASPSSPQRCFVGT
jgi:hypothetical protein